MATVHEFLKSRVRHLCSAVLILLGLVTLVPAFSGTVAAHHPEGSASVGCDLVIHYTAVAWGGYPDDPDTPEDEAVTTRSNGNVRARVEILAGSGVAPADQFGAFNTGNGYSFSGTFNWPAGATYSRVLFEAMQPWDSGGGTDSGAWPIYLSLPEQCPETTTTVEEETTTTVEEETTTTVEEETTTTTEDPTTTTTTTDPSTTTTTTGGGGGTTTTTTGGGNTTTTVGDGGGGGSTPTSVSDTLPRSGGGGQSKPMLSMAFGLACIGSALMLSRPRAPKRVTTG